MQPSANSAAAVAEAMNKLKSGQLAEAIATLEQAVAADPNDPQVYTCLGVAYTNISDGAAAIAAFEKALALQETPRAHYNLGVAYESAGRADEALRCFENATSLDPNYGAARQAVDRLTPPAPVVPDPALMTQAVANAPEQTIIGEAPVMPSAPAYPIIGDAPDLTSVFATPTAPPDIAKENMEREIRFAEQRRDYVKSALIYGTTCGAALILGLAFASCFFPLAGTLGMIYRLGLLKFTLLCTFVGAIYGAILGYWIGYTCGGEDAGRNAGAVMGAVFGLLSGLIAGMGVLSLFSMAMMAIIGAFTGRQIGVMVEGSIGWN